IKEISNNSSSWELLDLEKKSSEIVVEINRLDFLPMFTMWDNKTPIYTFREQNKKKYHNVSLSTGLSWLTPTDGTVLLSLKDSLIISDSDDGYIFKQSPTMSFSYSQPTYLGRGFIDPSLYEKKGFLKLDYYKSKTEIEQIIKRNRLIIDFVTALNSVRSRDRELESERKKLNLLDMEIKQLEI
ncbi:MAG: hypothetical protein OIF32_02870, partial [Campylobacterales bacterium]|nr:hypothetical protein [Campylobacterales bacterium]